jgi:hypothetical protein
MKATNHLCFSINIFVLIVDIISSLCYCFLLMLMHGSNYNSIDWAVACRDVHMTGALHAQIKQFMKLNSMSCHELNGSN